MAPTKPATNFSRSKPVIRVVDVRRIPGSTNDDVKATGVDRIYDLRSSEEAKEMWEEYFCRRNAFRELARSRIVSLLDSVVDAIDAKEAQTELLKDVGVYFNVTVSNTN